MAMETWLKYFVWVGWFLAAVGIFLGPAALVWVALYELVVGILLGISAFKGEVQGLFERAVFYGVAYGMMGLFNLSTILGFALAQWIAMYLALMAWMYIPAAILMYVGKIFKEGY